MGVILTLESKQYIGRGFQMKKAVTIAIALCLFFAFQIVDKKADDSFPAVKKVDKAKQSRATFARFLFAMLSL